MRALSTAHRLLHIALRYTHRASPLHSLHRVAFSTFAMTDATAAPLTIGTHDGAFHCDEALACFMLQQTAQFANAKIVRTRDLSLLTTLPIVVDVGAVYDPAIHRYDHHQRGFTETLSPDHTMKLSSAGLIYKHFGREVIANIIHPLTLSDNDAAVVYQQLYQNFIEPIDGIDNGVSQYDTDIKPKYRVGTDLSSRVGYLNPQWNQSASSEEIYAQFLRAVSLTGSELKDAIKFLVSSWLPARQVVYQAINERFTVHPSGQIIAFGEQRPIWKGHLNRIEKELDIDSDEHKRILYVLFADQAGKWRVQCVPEPDKEFESRKGLPEPWRGIRDQALSDLTGIPGCVFVHASGFIGGNETREGVLKMAVQAWELPAESNKRMKIDNSNCQ